MLVEQLGADAFDYDGGEDLELGRARWRSTRPTRGWG
jgi:hypothetical protein